MIGCKIEEIVCPRVSHFSYATDNGFTNQMIVDMEADISKVSAFTIPKYL